MEIRRLSSRMGELRPVIHTRAKSPRQAVTSALWHMQVCLDNGAKLFENEVSVLHHSIQKIGDRVHRVETKFEIVECREFIGLQACENLSTRHAFRRGIFRKAQ